MENTVIINDILNRYIVLKDRFYSQYNSSNDSVVSEYCIILGLYKDTYISRFSDTVNSVAPKAHMITYKDVELHEKDGHLFNVFNLWHSFSGITEPIHSRLIHFLMSNNKLHGQQNKFLFEFLNILDIEYSKKDRWDITAEKGRVDIMLRRDYPQSIIIIENKSNWADDQRNQMYRYWYENIYIKTKNVSKEFYENNSNNYQIIYLSPNTNKRYDEQSITKPGRDWFDNLTDFQYNNLPLKIPLAPRILTFDQHIVSWLEKCMDHLDGENYPLKNYIYQYINYCKKL